MKKFFVVMLAVVVFLLIAGCSDRSESILSPTDSPAPGTSVQPGSNTKVESPTPLASTQPGISTNCAITLIPLPQPAWDNGLGASSRSLITHDFGGQVRASFSYISVLGKRVSVSATFTVPPGAVDKDTYVTMSFDDKHIGVKFIPGGLKFNIPANLDFSASGLDLSIVPSGVPISLYYVSDYSLTFEKQKTSGISANKWSGTLVCNDGQINHFSRYAFGY
jgi:hypothetical protein